MEAVTGGLDYPRPGGSRTWWVAVPVHSICCQSGVVACVVRTRVGSQSYVVPSRSESIVSLKVTFTQVPESAWAFFHFRVFNSAAVLYCTRCCMESGLQPQLLLASTRATRAPLAPRLPPLLHLGGTGPAPGIGFIYL